MTNKKIIYKITFSKISNKLMINKIQENNILYLIIRELIILFIFYCCKVIWCSNINVKFQIANNDILHNRIW